MQYNFILKIACLLQSYFSTLCFRPRSELELVTCLLSVVKNVRETSVKMTVTAGARSQQWKERTLRSRARDTCLRMWATLPDLSTALLSLLMLTSLCYRNLPSLTQDNTALRYNTHPCTDPWNVILYRVS